MSAEAEKILIELNEQAYRYSNFNTADFSDHDPFVRDILCGYTLEQQRSAEAQGIESPCFYWNRMKNAEHRFRLLSLKARAVAPAGVLAAINQAEAGFEAVFEDFVGPENTVKHEASAYNRIMAPGT